MRTSIADVHVARGIWLSLLAGLGKDIAMLTGWRDFDDAFRAIDLLERRIDRAFDFWADASPSDSAVTDPERRRLLLGDRWRRRATTAWPATNVYEAKEAFIVKAEVPGLAESDVSVSLEDDALVLRGERKSQAPEGYKVHLRERTSVAFTRKLPLPSRVDVEGVTAALTDGVLTITLPKAKESLPRQIAVKAS
jgi:HSP20 family protein